jgi:hypothetical protein
MHFRPPFLFALLIFLIARIAVSAQNVQLTQRDSPARSLSDIFDRASRVVLVKVISGDSTTYDIPLYKAQIIQAFKGASNQDTIYFTAFAGIQIGSDYFLFLQNAPAPVAPKSKTALGFGTVSYSQLADDALPSTNQCIFPGADPTQHCADAVQICTDHIQLPQSFSLHHINASTSQCPWVKQTDFITALSNLVQSSR